MTNYTDDSSSPESRHHKKTALEHMSTRDGAKAEFDGKPVWVNPFTSNQGRRWTRDWMLSHAVHCRRGCARCRDVRRGMRRQTDKNAL
jgi:hypothetical protein